MDELFPTRCMDAWCHHEVEEQGVLTDCSIINSKHYLFQKVLGT